MILPKKKSWDDFLKESRKGEVLDSEGMKQLADWLEARASWNNTYVSIRKETLDDLIKFLRGE